MSLYHNFCPITVKLSSHRGNRSSGDGHLAFRPVSRSLYHLTFVARIRHRDESVSASCLHSLRLFTTCQASALYCASSSCFTTTMSSDRDITVYHTKSTIVRKKIPVAGSLALHEASQLIHAEIKEDTGHHNALLSTPIFAFGEISLDVNLLSNRM